MKKSTEDRLEGSARQAKGKARQEAGRVTKNRRLQAKGALEKNMGKAQRAVVRARARIEEDEE